MLRLGPLLAIGSLAGLLLLGSVSPVATANEEPIRCDHTPVQVIIGIAQRLQPFIDQLRGNTYAALGKAKCAAFQAAFLCSDEQFPPQVSAVRTNPTGVHGYFSPCFELFAPGFEHLGGCQRGEALRHTFYSNGYHIDKCVPLSHIVLPTGA